MGGAQFFGQFQAVFVHIADDNRGGAVKLRSQQGGHANGAGTGDEDGVARFDVSALHADFVGGGQDVGQQQGDFVVHGGGQRN